MIITKVDLIIQKPIFKLNGVEPAFGINETKFKDKSELLVYTSYRRVDGSIWNPNVFSVTRAVAMECRPSPAKSGVHLRLVPLSLMKVVGQWGKVDPPKQGGLFS